jgi:thymidylate synthase
MIVLARESANGLYIAACHEILRIGQQVAPRGMATKEVLGAHLCLTNPRRRYVAVPPARLLNPAFAVAEALWILSGSDDPWIFTFNRSLAQYADGGRLRGAYGPRMRGWRGELDQLAYVRELLQRDPDSRQAVIQLYDPQVDTRGHRDVPCTLNYRFFLRRGCLDMHTTMRSNDVWLGLPYDLFTATVLQELMAGWLGVELGAYHHHVDSLHLYQQHWLSAADVAASTVTESAVMPVLSAPADGLTGFLTAVVTGTAPPGADPAWHGIARLLASYRHWGAGDRSIARSLALDVEGDLGLHLRRWYDHIAARGIAASIPGGGAR